MNVVKFELKFDSFGKILQATPSQLLQSPWPSASTPRQDIDPMVVGGKTLGGLLHPLVFNYLPAALSLPPSLAPSAKKVSGGGGGGGGAIESFMHNSPLHERAAAAAAAAAARGPWRITGGGDKTRKQNAQSSHSLAHMVKNSHTLALALSSRSPGRVWEAEVPDTCT